MGSLTSPHIVAGLGNPGRAYEKTRHNVGFQVINCLCERHQVRLGRSRFGSLYGDLRAPDRRLYLVKPLTFMNLSGGSLAAWVNDLKVPLSQVLVICDDIDLPLGQIRLRCRGSAGGHRGLLSIIEHLGSQQFARLRIGVGRPRQPEATAERHEIIEHVLSRFTPREVKVVQEAILRASDAVDLWFEEGIDEAMNRFNCARQEAST